MITSGPVFFVHVLDAVLQSTTLETLQRADAHDAIVVGAGAAGGLAALALTEGGLRVLVLDAGWPASRHRSPLRRLTASLVHRMADPNGLRMVPGRVQPWVRSRLAALGRRRQPIQSTTYAWPSAPDAFVDDRDCPYATPGDAPFAWIRSRQLGGRMIVPGHGRQYFRLGPADLHPTDGLSPPWPFAASVLDSWYTRVEQRLGLMGSYDHIPWLPDSTLATELTPSVDQSTLQERITGRWPHARPSLGRFAAPLASLDAAARTGRLSCRQGAVVTRIDVDNAGRVSGVTWLDEETRSTQQTRAPLVFLCASTLESTRILLLSQSANSPAGLGGSSGQLGRNLMDHVLVRLQGHAAPLRDPSAAMEVSRCVYLPRFDARHSSTPDQARGFGVQLHQFPDEGRSHFVAAAFGEMLPHAENRVSVDAQHRDAWGIPALRIECRHTGAEIAVAQAQAEALRELGDLLDVEAGQLSPVPVEPGAAIHECGTARMGADPSSSVLDPDNQCWEARGLYVTDGASFPSQGYQNPTLTILALTERACDHALTTMFGRPPARS